MKAKEINELKLPLEAKLSNKIYKVFKNQANDVARLFLVDKLDSKELADNYRPEMLKEVRDGLRMSIGAFGYSLRNSIEKQFNVAFQLDVLNNCAELLIPILFSNTSSISVSSNETKNLLV
jgi:hypothetical protein